MMGLLVDVPARRIDSRRTIARHEFGGGDIARERLEESTRLRRKLRFAARLSAQDPNDR
jgi:hypothetical protein